MTIEISVVICTFNRADLVNDILGTLTRQTFDRSRYEVIVVDNCSTDNTKAVVGSHAGAGNIIYCYEPEPGSSQARNHGWRVARGQYIAFVDDDCRVPEQWLERVAETIAVHAPAIFGGPLFPFYLTKHPRWHKDSYGSYDLGGDARALTTGYLFGGNICFQRSILEALGGYDDELGIKGEQAGYGEEVMPQVILRSTMPDKLIYYDPCLFMYHLVRPEKLKISWILGKRLSQGGYTYRMLSRNTDADLMRVRIWKQFIKMGIALAMFGIDTCFLSLLRDRSAYPYLENYIYEKSSQHLAHFSALRELARSAKQARTQVAVTQVKVG